jgi:hypothetical protein
MRKNTVEDNIHRDDVLFLTDDSKAYRINDMYQQGLYSYKILADKQQ